MLSAAERHDDSGYDLSMSEITSTGRTLIMIQVHAYDQAISRLKALQDDYDLEENKLTVGFAIEEVEALRAEITDPLLDETPS